MKIDKKTIEQMESDRQHQDYRLEKILLNFTAEICARMQLLGINRAELAKRLGTSRAFVSKILSCNHNITLKTMDSLSHVLGMELDIEAHAMKSIEEKIAANNEFIFSEYVRTAHTAITHNRVVVNEAHLIPSEILESMQNMSPSIYAGKQESGNDYDHYEVKYV